MESVKEIYACPACEGLEIFLEGGGVLLCQDCGFTSNPTIDMTPEWINGEMGKDRARCVGGVNRLLPQSSLGTSLHGGKRQVLRAHNWGRYPYREKSRIVVFSEIDRVCRENRLGNFVAASAQNYFTKMADCKHQYGKNEGRLIIMRGINRRSIIAACVFYACKKMKLHQNTKEVAAMFKVASTEMSKGCKNVMKMLKLENIGIPVDPSNTLDFINRFCKDLNLDKEATASVISLVNNINKLGIISDHTPYSIASGSILFISEMSNIVVPKAVNKKKISLRFKVSEVTINKIIKKIDECKKIVFDDNKTELVSKQIGLEIMKVSASEELLERFTKFGIAPPFEKLICASRKKEEELFTFRTTPELSKDRPTTSRAELQKLGRVASKLEELSQDIGFLVLQMRSLLDHGAFRFIEPSVQKLFDLD